MAFAVAATLIAAVVVVAITRSRDSTTSGSGTSSRTSAASSVPGSTSASVSPSSSAPATGPSVPLLTEGYVPLFPFTDLADAQAWERGYREGGHQPWHLDAGATAVAFSRGYLGFTEVDQVTSRSLRNDGAHVGVGYRNPAGRLTTAAVLHLMRFGTDALAPWEVVGSDDSTFTFDIPEYGSHVTSPLRVGGRITGVDENIVVAVHQLQADHTLGQTSGTPAGGEATPWAVTVSYAGARPGALTVVARTGGHTQQVERFAVNGLYA